MSDNECMIMLAELKFKPCCEAKRVTVYFTLSQSFKLDLEVESAKKQCWIGIPFCDLFSTW